MTDNSNSMFLPQECWELVFNSLSDERHFESVSLVSHHLLSITNHLRSSLKITPPVLPLLPHLFLRFKNLKKIDLSRFQGDPDAVLSLLSRSELDLESLNISNLKRFPQVGLRELGLEMKNLKDLNCSRIWGLQDPDLFVISDSCTSLEALDISFPEYDDDFSTMVTDSAVVALSEKLTSLTKIDISGNMFITDKSLVSISTNCVMLREFGIRDCDFITLKGIGVAMRGLPNLVSLCVGGIGIPSIDSCFKESFASCVKGLCLIEFSNSFISDELICSIANACLPLKTVVFSRCYNFSFAGMCFLMSKYRFIEHLNLEGANFLNDGSMIVLCTYLRRLKSINLDFCSKLTNSTFFTLVRECRMLSEIRMETTNLGLEESTMKLVVNPQVKLLHLAQNGNMTDEFLKKVATLCPNLQLLDVSSCTAITEEGVGEVLKSCDEIQCLEISSCRQISSLGIKDNEVEKLEKLEKLEVGGSGIDDDALTTIANTCPRLLNLNLYNCIYVTARGVREVVEKCSALREISLWGCQNVNADILSWMVFTRPSLRKIVAESNKVPSESQRNLLLRHGCVVSGLSTYWEDYWA